MAIQETEEVNLTSGSQQHSRRSIQHCYKQCKLTESEFVFAQRKASREFVNTKCEIFHLSPITFRFNHVTAIFKLVWALCPPVAGLEKGFVFHYARSFRSVLNFFAILHVSLWCREN